MSVLLVDRVTDAERLHARDEQLLELVGDVVVHDEPLGRDAALPVVLHARGHRGLRGLLEVGRRHHDERVAAAELEHDRLELLARDPPDRTTGGRAPGERRGTHARIAQDPLDRTPRR